MKNGRTRAKGYADWRPQDKTLTLVAGVREILEEYRAHLPLTIRQVFYRLVGAYGYPKDENAYERLCNALNRARRAGYIGFEELRDDGISVMQPNHYAGVEDFYGDLDPSGVSIYESMREDVLAFVAGDVPHIAADEVAIFDRVALSRGQVEYY